MDIAFIFSVLQISSHVTTDKIWSPFTCPHLHIDSRTSFTKFTTLILPEAMASICYPISPYAHHNIRFESNNSLPSTQNFISLLFCESVCKLSKDTPLAFFCLLCAQMDFPYTLNFGWFTQSRDWVVRLRGEKKHGDCYGLFAWFLPGVSFLMA